MLKSLRRRAPKRLDVIVTQGWGRIAYNIVRSLGRKGLKVGLGVDNFLGMAVVSRYTAAVFRHPSFITQPMPFLAAVRDALQRYQARVYIPADQDVFAVAKYRRQFQDLEVCIPIARYEILRRLHKKDELMQVAESMGLPTPETLVPRNESDLVAFAREYGDPVVVKALSSAGARGVSYITQETLSKFLNGAYPDKELVWGKFLVQRYVRGTGYGVSMLFNRGSLRAKFVHKRLREKFETGGISTLRMSVVNPILEDHAEHLLSQVGFHGVAMVEFKYDERSGQKWLIDVNPRFWGSLGLAIQAGVDFPHLLYRMAEEGDVRPVLQYRQGVVMKWVLGDLFARAQQLRHARLPQWKSTWFQTNGYDDFYLDDPLPFLAEVALSIRKQLKMRRARAHEMDPDLDTL